MITRRDIFVATLSIALTAAALALAGNSPKPVLHSTVFQWAELKPATTKTGARRAVCDAPTLTLANLEIHITTLNPGEMPHPIHHHPDEELMILKEGTVAAFQEGRTNVVDQGGIIFEASNETHGLQNIGHTPATYYVIKFAPHDLPKATP